jgi:hypothetical protein
MPESCRSPLIAFVRLLSVTTVRILAGYFTSDRRLLADSVEKLIIKTVVVLWNFVV